MELYKSALWSTKTELKVARS